MMGNFYPLRRILTSSHTIFSHPIKDLYVFPSIINRLLHSFVRVNTGILRNASFLLPVLFVALTGNAKTYYLSGAGDDVANGTSSSTPWKSINKLNSFRLKPGDSVLFNRGDIFYGPLIVNASGNPAKGIVYGSYGTGANPVITGFTSVNSWNNLGGNIWESANAISTLPTCNMVVINGVNTPMGRYPNTGYLIFQNFSGNTSITSSSLTGSPNWTGAEVVIKKNRWILDRNKITSQSGGTLTYTSGSLYNPLINYGFFIQNDSRTLDSPNEWYYNPATKKIQVYSLSSPANVEVSTIDTLVYIRYKNYITFTDLTFTGANFSGLYIGSCSNLTIQNCSIDFCNNGIFGGNWGSSSGNFILKNSTVNHTNNNGVGTTSEFTGASITGNTIKNSGMLPGMGGNGDGQYLAMTVSGSNSIIKNNEVDSTGYNGIAFLGNSVTVSNNLINYFCLIKDDGGAIYTENPASGNIVSFNTILNGIGNGQGSSNPGGSSAMGIYCDNNTSGLQILNNSLANIGFAGIYLHDAMNIITENNTVYNCIKMGMLIKNDQIGTFIRNITVKNNILFAKDSTQMSLQPITLHNDIAQFGIIDYNYYAKPIFDSLVVDAQPVGITGINDYYTLEGWQTYSAFDSHTQKSPKKITTTNDLRFEYNATSIPISVSLPYNYMDVKGAVYNGVIKLAPYSSAVLIRNGALTNKPPTANAGPDQTIILPINSVNLAGSGTDSDGTVSAYQWIKISGPAGGTITNSNSASTSVTGLAQGVYNLELTVTDNDGAVGKDTMKVTVNSATNQPPTANAGPDQTITLPTNTVNLSGVGTDPDGTVSSYKWAKISGPTGCTISNINSASTSVTGLTQGVYNLELTVTDNNGAVGKDTIKITVNSAGSQPAPNKPPIANAGPDQTIILPTNNVNLSGTGTDSDGTVSTYLWTRISGPTGCTISNINSASTSVTGLAQGVYNFVLTVTDNSGAVGKDTMKLTVNSAGSQPAPNKPPIANAGPDQTIILPTNNVNLSGIGTDSDGTVSTYLWTRISGPTGCTISNINSGSTSVTGLAQGVYNFVLTVTDNSGAVGKDTIMITVNSAGTMQPPTALAGEDQSITLPVDSVSLNGSGNDAGGTIASYLWTKISGPGSGAIANVSSPATMVTGLVQGVYEYQFEVTDKNGTTGKDTIQITVNAANNQPAPNIPPIANAGPGNTITLPVNKTALLGSGKDADGKVVRYLWTKISGPESYEIIDESSPVAVATGLIQGVYKFVLEVTDNDGATGTDTTQVTVNKAVNIPPVADAGQDQTVILPVNTVSLNGSGSYANGTIESYSWIQISGPKISSIEFPDASVTETGSLVAGSYAFELTITDNSGAISRDTMVVNVEEPGYNPDLLDNSLRIYPNPVVRTATLEINTSQVNSKLLVIITNMQGQVVYKKEFASEEKNIKNPIDMSNLANGTYAIIVYFNNHENRALKVIKAN